MGMLHEQLIRLYVEVVSPPRERDERGDVPGWVLITLMSVILMGALLAVAEPQLTRMLRTALNSVR